MTKITVLINGYHVYRQPEFEFFGKEIAPNLNQSQCGLVVFLISVTVAAECTD